MVAAFNSVEATGAVHLSISELVANNIVVAALALYIWEWLSTLPDEYRLYKTHRFTSRQVLLFVLIRYGTIPALILPAYSIWHSYPGKANACVAHQQLAICFVQLIVSVIFAWRSIAICQHQRSIIAFFVIVVCAQFSATFALLWHSQVGLSQNGTCMPLSPVERPSNRYNLLWIFYAVNFFYDILTFTISTYKLWKLASLGRHSEVSQSSNDPQHLRKRSFSVSSRVSINIKETYKAMASSPLSQQLIKDGLAYFLMATLFNATAFALEISKTPGSKALTTLYAPVMCVLYQRIILRDVKNIYGGHHQRNITREQLLMGRVTRRHSWEVADRRPPLRHFNTNSTSCEKQSSRLHDHIAVDMDSPIAGVLLKYDGDDIRVGDGLPSSGICLPRDVPPGEQSI